MVTTVVPESRPAFVALAGPTASGKTAAALAVARRWPVEIVSVDSALVYRGMDLGTAKPTAAERATVPHHLIDIRDPAQAYSAAEFARDAARLVQEIRARGALPLLVGGTMLYFKALFEGLADMPAANPAVRAALEGEAARVGWPAMHARLAEVDPVTAARLAPNDAQRIQRALEVWQVSGQPLSAWHARGAGPEPGPQTPSGSTLRPSWDMSAARETNAAEGPLRPALFLSLEPADRSWLHARIAQRFDEMLRAGFLEEVNALRARGDLSPTLPSLRSVGYRQAWEWLDHAQAGAPQPLNLLRERGIAATRQLAKRQITWLRSMPWRQVIAADAPDASSQVIAAIDATRNALGLAAPAQPPSPIPGERR